MEEDDGTTATQTVKLLEDKGYKISRTNQSQQLSWFAVSSAIRILQLNSSRFSVKVDSRYPLTLIH